MECILLSFIYGISENTVSLNELSDILVDVTGLRYFHAFCAQLSNNQSANTEQAQSNQISSFFSIASKKLQPTHDTISTSIPLNSNEVYDNLLFFWFDVMKLKQMTEEMRNGAIISLPTVDTPPETPHVRDMSSLIRYARELCTQYMSESGALSLPVEVCSNRDRNQIRTFVLQLTQLHLPNAADEEGYIGGSWEGDNNNHSPLSGFLVQEDSDSRSGRSEASGEDQEEEEGEKMSDEEIRRNLVDMFSKPAIVALLKLEGLMDQFKQSMLYNELNHILRMKTEGRQRSLYRDICSSLVLWCTRCNRHRMERSFANSSSSVTPQLYNFIAKEKENKRKAQP